MKKRLYILIGLFVFFQFSFSTRCVLLRYYDSKGGKVTYNSAEILEAEAESFEVLDAHFARDANHVYYKGKKVLGVDSLTFVPVKAEEYNGYCNFSGERVGNLKLRIIKEFKDKNGTYKLEDIQTRKLKLEK